MSSNKKLFSTLNVQAKSGLSPLEGVAKIKDQFTTASVNEWANAVHFAWISTIALEDLVDALNSIERFTTEETAKAADVYFLEIVIKIDTTRILAGTYSLSPAPVDQYVVFTSNHKSVTSGQGTNELDAENLQPNESIFWQAISNTNNQDTIELVKFHASPVNPNADFSEMIAAPKHMNGNASQFHTTVKSNPTLGIKYAYSFDFTINQGSQLFTFDPWLGD